MADTSLPYINAHGNITKVLTKIKEAETPPRFNKDYLETTFQMTGGSATPVIPYLKRLGFLNSDGTPTERYKRFRGAESGAAAAEAIRVGYQPLYKVNEYAHNATDAQLRDLIIQVTGVEKGSQMVGRILSSFKAVKAFADFSAAQGGAGGDGGGSGDKGAGGGGVGDGELAGGLQLGYTINLHLPPSSDVAVFDAIFRSLKEHLIQ